MKKAVQNIGEIRDILKKHKIEVQQQFNVIELGIFGSFARGEQDRKSDIDILVEFDGLPDIFRYIELEDYLRKLLKRKVDLVRKQAIRPELKKRILKEAVYV